MDYNREPDIYLLKKHNMTDIPRFLQLGGAHAQWGTKVSLPTANFAKAKHMRGRIAKK